MRDSSTKEHEGAQRKTDLEKHLCGLSNLKSIGRTREEKAQEKPFRYKDL